jgi:hypothetical protein
LEATIRVDFLNVCIGNFFFISFYLIWSSPNFLIVLILI